MVDDSEEPQQNLRKAHKSDDRVAEAAITNSSENISHHTNQKQLTSFSLALNL